MGWKNSSTQKKIVCSLLGVFLNKNIKTWRYLFLQKGLDVGEAQKTEAVLFPCALSMQCAGHAARSSPGGRCFLVHAGL